MRSSLGLLCCLSVCGQDLTQLRQMEEKGRVFELRRSVEKGREAASDADTLYYRALVTAGFGQETIAIGQFRTFLANSGKPMLNRKAHGQLALAYLRLGQYRDATSEWTEALRLVPPNDPERSAVENVRSLCESLRDVPPQAIEFGPGGLLQAKRNPLGSWNVPVETNGKTGEWAFDTGATFSTLVESEAMKMGLAIRDPNALVGGGHTGKTSSTRLAVADDLRVGAATLHNVVFLVVADSALHFGFHQMRGVLGLPVIRALGCVGISAKGEVRIQKCPANPKGDANLSFDGLGLIAEVGHAGHAKQMVVDSGGTGSYLYSSFRDALDAEERNQLKSKQETFNGIGGSLKQIIEIVPALRLEIPGRVVQLNNVSMRPQAPTPSSDGLLGMDALLGGFRLDFRAMQIQLD